MKITKPVRIPENLMNAINEPLSTLVSRLAAEFVKQGKQFTGPTYSEPVRTSIYIDHLLLENIKDMASEAGISLELAISQLLETHVYGAPRPVPDIKRRAPRT